MIKCKTCGTKIKPENKRHVYCSYACLMAGLKKKAGAPQKEYRHKKKHEP